MVIFNDKYTNGIVDYLKRIDKTSIKRASFGVKSKHPINYDIYYEEVVFPEIMREHDYDN